LNLRAPTSIRARLTLWYVSVLAILLLIYAGIVFVFQYATLTKQIFHDEVQDVETVEGLLYFDTHGILQLRQDYYSRPQSRLLIDRMMEVRNLSGDVLYRSSTLGGLPLGGPVQPREGDTSFNERILRLADGRHVFIISHIHGMNGRTLLIRLGYSLVPLRDRMWQFLLILLIALPVALTIAALAGQAIARRALRPLEEMALRAEGITATNLHDRLLVSDPDDELGQLGRAFNHLLQRLEQAFQQLQRFTADVAHELRTPLASLRAVGEVALGNEHDSNSYREAISSILEETGRLNETVDSLLLLAYAETTHTGSGDEVFPIGELIAEVLGVLGILLEERQINVVQEGSTLGKTAVRAERGLLRVAMLNVLHNALKFSPSGSTIKISYGNPDAREESICVVVEDQGPGLAPGEHERVFERFFRGHTQPAEGTSGSGLGLSIARLVIDRSGGKISFDETAIYGARCSIYLPVAGRG
jgi:heavy metal sensor kinase